MPRRTHRTNRRNMKRRNTKRRNLRKYKGGGVNKGVIKARLPSLGNPKTLEDLGIDINKCTITKTEESRTIVTGQFGESYPRPSIYEIDLDGFKTIFS